MSLPSALLQAIAEALLVKASTKTKLTKQTIFLPMIHPPVPILKKQQLFSILATSQNSYHFQQASLSQCRVWTSLATSQRTATINCMPVSNSLQHQQTTKTFTSGKSFQTSITATCPT
jgi:hypothetical protein